MSTYQDDEVQGSPHAAPGVPRADQDADLLRRALQDAARGIKPSPWPGRAVLERAGRSRRNRRLTITLSAVAVVAAAGSGVLVTENHAGAPAAGSPVAPAAPAPTHTAPRVPATPPSPTLDWPTVRVVRPSRVVVMGEGPRLRLEPTQRCLGSTGDWTCKSVADGNQAADSVSLQSEGGDTAGTLYTPLYIGSRTAARMSVTVAGHEYPLQVVTLPGHPGYATGYGTAPAPSGADPAAFTQVKVTVYDARGEVLATLP